MTCRGASVADPLPGLRPVPLSALGQTPLVSVLISNHNYGRYIGEALSSVLTQSYVHFEVVVCDDGSTDDSWFVIDRYAKMDRRVRVVRQSNRGQASAVNAAYREARGEIICFLDADDTFMPSKLGKIVTALREGVGGFVIHSMVVVDGSGRAIQQIPLLGRLRGGWLAPEVIRRGGRWRTVPTSGLSMVREISRRVFPIPEGGIFRKPVDSFVLPLAPLLTPVICVEDVLATYRVHGANAFGGTGVTEAYAKNHVVATYEAAAAVNARLQAIGIPVEVNAQRNAKLLEYELMLGLLRGDRRRALCSLYRRAVPSMLEDDVRPPMLRLTSAAVYAVALGLPRGARGRWLSLAIGFSRGKGVLIQAWRCLTRSRRSGIDVHAGG